MTLLFSRDAPGSLLSLHLSPLPCARLTSLNSLSVFSPAVGHAWQPVLRGDAPAARGSAPRAEILAAPAARRPSATFALLRKVPGPPRCPSQPPDSPASSRRTHISLFPTGRWQPPVCPRERRPAAAAPRQRHGPRDARRPHACSHLPHRVQLEGDTIPVPGWGAGHGRHHTRLCRWHLQRPGDDVAFRLGASGMRPGAGKPLRRLTAAPPWVRGARSCWG